METYTLTFGDQAENHVGMQKIGTLADVGFTYDDLIQARDWFRFKGGEADVISLQQPETPDAWIMIARRGLASILNPGTIEQFFDEQQILPKDTQAKMYGRVVQKRARHNLCFDEVAFEPNYGAGRGRIVAFSSVPLLNQVREAWGNIIGLKGANLVAEGNYYVDITKMGIGFHGDSERKKVIAVRVGASLPLQFNWFHQSKAVGEPIQFQLNSGDVYIMSEKATGNDWKRRSIYTLRHAAGCKKYLTIKN